MTSQVQERHVGDLALRRFHVGEPMPGVVQNTQININLPAPLSDAQFRALLEPPQKAEIIDAEAIR